MMTEEARQEAAAGLATAARTRQPVPPLSEVHAGLEVTDAYEIQLINVRDQVARGARVRGHKVGLTSAVMQQMLGVNEPDYGHLLDDTFFPEGSVVPIDRFLAPRVEIEVAFVLGAPLKGPGISAADVLRATEFVMPAIEIIDSRVEDWRITLPDTIADNASVGGIVLGGAARSVDGLDLRTLGAVLRKNGGIVETGAAGAVLGNPVNAVAWLANTIGRLGMCLDEGHAVLPGSCTAAVPVAAGDTARGDFDELGHVSITFGAGGAT